jgi:hypothetical protein
MKNWSLIHMVGRILILFFLGSISTFASDANNVDLSKYLFVENYQIDRMENVTRTLHSPLKSSTNPVIVPDMPWEGAVILQPGTVIYDEEEHIFKMWYNSLPTQSKPDIQEFVCYATSTDGIHWVKPKLNIVEFRGSTANNIVLKWTSWTLSVIKDTYAPDPSKRYKLAYWSKHDLETEGVWVAFSPDGVHWSVNEHNPVIPRTATGDTFSVMQDPVTHTFWMYHKSAIMPIRKVSRLVSDDFVNWTNDELVLEPDDRDQPDTEFYGLSPFAYGNQYLGFLWVLHTYTQQIDVQLVSSRDGKVWNRSVNRRVFLPLGFMNNGYPGHAFDSEMIMSIAPPVAAEGQLFIYYTGFSVKHNANFIETVTQYPANSSQLQDDYIGDIGVATLPVDNFVSLDATSEGYVVTRLTRLRGSALHVYGSTGVIAAEDKPENNTWSRLYSKSDNGQGEIRVEIEDVQGKPLPGYSWQECQPIKGTFADRVVRWNGKRGIKQLDGQSVKLKFVLENAKLFSYFMQ